MTDRPRSCSQERSPRWIDDVPYHREKENDTVSKSVEELPLSARATLGVECVACRESNRQLQNIRHLLARTQKVNEDLAAESTKWRTQFETATQQLSRQQVGHTRMLEDQLRAAMQEQQQQRDRTEELEKALSAEIRASQTLMEQLRQQQTSLEELNDLRAVLKQSTSEIEKLRDECAASQQMVPIKCDMRSTTNQHIDWIIAENK